MIVAVVVEDRRRNLQDTPKTFHELLSYTIQAFQPCLDAFADKTVNFQVLRKVHAQLPLHGLNPASLLGRFSQWIDEEGDKITISSGPLHFSHEN
jgi:hypothetical protein